MSDKNQITPQIYETPPSSARDGAAAAAARNELPEEVEDEIFGGPRPERDVKEPPAASLQTLKADTNDASHVVLSTADLTEKAQDLFDRLIELLELNIDDQQKDLEAAMTLKSFIKFMNIETFASLAMVDENDLLDPQTSTFAGAFAQKVFRKKFLTVVNYCGKGLAILPVMSFNDIIQGINLPPQSQQLPQPAAIGSPQSHARKQETLKFTFDKDFPTFNGTDKQWKTWSKAIINATGVAGGKQYLFIKRTALYPGTVEVQLSEQLFYRLKQALQAGSASMFAEAVERDCNCCPATLWTRLQDHYEHAISKDLQVVEATRELLSLTLDDNGAATTFVQKFTKCVSDLEKTASALPKDNITLRAIIINAIKSHDYDTALSDILDNSGDTWQDALRRLRVRETQNIVRFSDTAQTGGIIQRRQHSGGKGKAKSASGGSVARSPNSTDHKPKEIPSTGVFFPPYPKSSAKLMNDNAFKALTAWRSMLLNATPGTQLRDLYTKFDASIQSVEPRQKPRSQSQQRGSSQSGGKSQQNKHKRQRRAIKVEEGAEDSKPPAREASDTEESDYDGGSTGKQPPIAFHFVPKRKQRRMSLANPVSDAIQQQQPPRSEEPSATVDFDSPQPFSGVKHIKLRHLSTSQTTTPHNGILDNGADQVMISINVATVQVRSGQFLEVDGPLSGRASVSQRMELCTLDTLMEFEDGSKLLARFHQSLLDPSPDQTESLLQPYQMAAHGVRMCLLPREAQRPNGEPGEQCLVHPNTLEHQPFFFDGLCYVRLTKPTDTDYASYQVVEMTSPLPYEPTRGRAYTRRLPKGSVHINTDQIQLWTANLGFPPAQVVENTLKNTTRYVNTLESENRQIMRDHQKARAIPLRPHRINERAFSDTYISCVESVRGYKYF